MAESTTVVEQSNIEEPEQYFKGKQWYSAKRGEWIGGDNYFILLFSQIVNMF